ncbi:MAG: hypothetical protein CMJ18_17810 [Phycisphaeraceae bacterium]|nr:hypothetical protein [Phycisphaeraceae bacterium]
MNEFQCENFLAPADPNEAGYVQSKHFLRQWYLHGPFQMSPEVRAAAEQGRWDEVLDAEAVSDEANLKPNVQPVSDPRDMVELGAWMRWESQLIRSQRKYPEKIVPSAMLHEWYLLRHPGYPQADMPPGYVHLPIEAYTKDDELMPCFTELDARQQRELGIRRQPYCPRCETRLEMETQGCPGCGQRLGGYVGYSAPGWPRKTDWRPSLPDDYSIYFLAAYLHAPPDIRRMRLLIGSEGQYKLFVNGQEVGRYAGDSRWPQWDTDESPEIELDAGWNLLLVKLAHSTIRDDHRFFYSRTENRTAFFARPVTPDKRVVAVHDFASDQFAPECELRITMSDPIPIGLGPSPRLRRFPDGTLVCTNFRSTDHGNTWGPCPSLFVPGMGSTFEDTQPADAATWEPQQDPATLVMALKCWRIGDGVFQSHLCRSTDGWQTREVLDVTIHLEHGADLVDEGNVEAGPAAIRGQNIVGLPDGSLVMPMYGSLKQDVVWFDLRMKGYLKYPQEWPRQFKFRSWLMRSEDGGLNWHYHGTIAALPELGDESFGEPNIALLADGSLMALLRNGGGDQAPLWMARSWDGGRTWSHPVPVNTPTGNAPQILQLPNGVLACAFGRPDSRVSFDHTGSGLAWSHTVVASTCWGNRHVEIAVTGPDTLYCVYADDECDVQGNRMPSKVRQMYGRRIRVERLQEDLRNDSA